MSLNAFNDTDTQRISDVLEWAEPQVRRKGKDAGASHAVPRGGLIRLIVTSVADDYVVCRAWDGTTQGSDDIKVAKPFPLRKTPYHGRTITINGVALTFSYTGGSARTVTKSGGSENQIIIPAYTGSGAGYAGEEIYAVNCATGVTVSSEVLGLMDLNVAGRMWAKV